MLSGSICESHPAPKRIKLRLLTINTRKNALSEPQAYGYIFFVSFPVEPGTIRERDKDPGEKNARQAAQLMSAGARRIKGSEMLNLPNTGFKVYQVQLYNEQVRSLVMRKRKHGFYDRHWAAAQVRDVVARDEAEAWTLISERFPPEEGFVVESITASRF